MVTLQSRLYQVLLRIDVSSSSSHESFLHGCLGLAASSQASFCKIKPLCIGEFRWNNSSNRKKSLLLAECHEVLRVYAADIIIASPSKRLAENTERSVCGDLADIATLSDAIQRFSVCNGFSNISKRGCKPSNNDTRFLANEGAEADRLLKENTNEEDDEQDKLVEQSSALLEKDECSVVPEDEMHIIEEERLRRKRISEANKNKAPWNKGKGKGKGKGNKYKQGMQSSGSTMRNYTVQKAVENDEELLVKEKQRRRRIAAANAGKAAWNKGREHSEETRQRIRERTAEAMKNPKVRDKLRIRSTLLSNETKSKIKATMLHSWHERKKLKSIQETCIEEWKECVADSARRGFGGDIKYGWNSYITILRELQHGWRSKNKRSCKEAKVRMTASHRIKEAETKTCRTGKGTSKAPEATVTQIEIFESIETDEALKLDGDSRREMGPEIWQQRVKGLPAYRNPSNSEMLERLKQIRAKRRLKDRNQRRAFRETNQRMAVERARILMGRAWMAARALEALAATNKGVLLSLQDAQQLLSEAEGSLKGAGFEGENFM